MIRILVNILNSKMKIRKFLKEENGGSMIESGLLIALSLMLFLILIAMVTDIYDWIDEKFQDVISFFEPLE